MTGQILAVLMVPMLRTLAIKARASRISETSSVPADPEDLTGLTWPFQLYNERDRLAAASKPTIYNQEEADNR